MERPRLRSARAKASDAPFPEEHDEHPDGSHANWIPRTSPGDHVTGSCALNVRGPGVGPCGDWHSGSWRSPCAGIRWEAHQAITTATCHYQREFELLRGIIADEEVVDAREALRKMGHPAGSRKEGVWFATHVRAIIEEAWGPIQRYPDPDPVWPVDAGEVAWWLCLPEQWAKLHQLAERIGATLEPGSPIHTRWYGWKERQSPRSHYTRPEVRWKGIEAERAWIEAGCDERTAA